MQKLWGLRDFTKIGKSSCDQVACASVRFLQGGPCGAVKVKPKCQWKPQDVDGRTV